MRFKASTPHVTHHRFSNNWVGGLHDHSGLLVALQSLDDYGSTLAWHLSAIGVDQGQLNITRISNPFFTLHRTLRPIAAVGGRYCVAITRGRVDNGDNTTLDVDETVYIIDTKRAKLRRSFPLASDFQGSELVVCSRLRCFAYLAVDKKDRKHICCRSLRDGAFLWRYDAEEFQNAPRIAIRAGTEHIIVCCAEKADGCFIVSAQDGSLYWRPKMKTNLHQCLRCEVALQGAALVLFSYSEPSGLFFLDLAEKRLTTYLDILPAMYPPSMSVCENRLFVVQDTLLAVFDLTNDMRPILSVPSIESGDSRAPYRIAASSSFVIMERHGAITCVALLDSVQ